MSSTDSTTVLTPGAIPAEFRDHLVPEMLLAPDAQYLLSKWLYAAKLARQFGDLAGFDLTMTQFKEGRMGPTGLAANMDAAMSAGMGGPLVLSSMSYPDMFVIEMDPAKAEAGEVIKVNRPVYLSNDKTESKRILGTNDQLFGSGSQVPSMGQIDVVIKEYFGPTDASGNKAPLNLAQFTRNRSYHDLLKYIGLLLRQDRYSLEDAILHARVINALVAAGYITRPIGMTQNSDYTAAGNEPFTYDLLVRANESMDSTGRFAPTTPQGMRVAVLDTHQVADLALDPMYQRLAVYQPEYNPLFPGYVKTVDKVIICRDNNMPRLSSFGAFSGTGYQGFIVSPGIFAYGCALDAVPLRDRNDDGGRFDRYGWHAFEGYQVADDRFGQLIITD